jgi:excinuclease ABC subunit C
LKDQGLNTTIASLRERISFFPDKPGIYQFYDNSGNIIYVGKAKNLKKRVASYFFREHENRKTALLVRNIRDITHMIVDTEQDALLLENNLIKKYQPRFNIRLKDDKSYPWICIKNEPFPRVFQTRNVIKDGSKYFGPYTSINTVRILLDLFKSEYKLRSCNYNLTRENIKKDKYKVCLEYHIGNCEGPCEGFISEEAYNKKITEIADILNGNISGVIKQLEYLMKDRSEKLDFEEAQKLKEKYNSLKRYQSKSTIVSPHITDVDVFSIDQDDNFAFVNYLKVIKGAVLQTYTLEIKKSLNESAEDLLMAGIIEIRQKIDSFAHEFLLPFQVKNVFEDVTFNVPQRGDKKKLLDLSFRNAKYFRLEREKQFFQKNPKIRQKRILNAIQKDLRLPELPVTIECFDNSNLQGSHPVAACVVFKEARPLKKEYRHYNIKSVQGSDDYASMEEVVQRRYQRLLNEDKALPQLIVIDGGKGQLSSAVHALEKLNIRGKISIISIAKRLEEIYFPNDSVPLYIDKNSETLRVIQYLRDEAHRFGIQFHRNKRSSGMIASELDGIKGIGEKTIKKLFIDFRSIKNIRKADKNQLAQSIRESKGGIIYNYFHPNR